MGAPINFNAEFSDEEYELYCDLHDVIARHVRKHEFPKKSLKFVLNVLSARQLAYQYRDHDDTEILEIKNGFNLLFNTNFERALMQEKET